MFNQEIFNNNILNTKIVLTRYLMRFIELKYLFTMSVMLVNIIWYSFSFSTRSLCKIDILKG